MEGEDYLLKASCPLSFNTQKGYIAGTCPKKNSLPNFDFLIPLKSLLSRTGIILVTFELLAVPFLFYLCLIVSLVN